MEVDSALTLLGSYGRWQIFLFINLSVFMMFPSVFLTYGYLFQAYTPPHHCQVPYDFPMNVTIPWNDKQRAYSSCQIYVNSSLGNETVACRDAVNQWDYYGESNNTIVSEWNLVCERGYLKKTTSSMFGFGVLIGTALFSPLQDYFGRKPFFLICLWLTAAIGVWNAFVYNYYVYLVVRFLLGTLRPAFGLAAFTLACELFSANYRTFAGIIVENFWGLAVSVLALLMHLLPNWRHLQLFVSLFGLLSIPLFWLLPESIPWLISKGKVDEAERVIQQAARVNRIKNFPPYVFKSPPKEETDEEPQFKLDPSESNLINKFGTLDEIYESNLKLNHENQTITMKDYNDFQNEILRTENNNKAYAILLPDMIVKLDGEKISLQSILEFQEEQSKPTASAVYTMFDVLKHPRLRVHIIVSCILWFVNSTVYYGMTLNTEDLAGNRHLNLFLSGLVEIPAYTLSYFIINKWGRRIPLVIFHILAGVFLIISQVITKDASDISWIQPLQIALTMSGKFCITASYGIVILYITELFPTTVRNQSMGFSAFCGRIGNIVAPFTSSLNAIHPWLTAVVFGVVSIVGGLLTLTLPETNKRPLPQTIDDVDNWYKPVGQNTVNKPRTTI